MKKETFLEAQDITERIQQLNLLFKQGGSLTFSNNIKDISIPVQRFFGNTLKDTSFKDTILKAIGTEIKRLEDAFDNL